MATTIIAPLLGGGLIGLSASLMLLALGKVTGISGIVGGAIGAERADLPWRLVFAAGLVAGGAVAYALLPESFGVPTVATLAVVAAGLLVGFGTRLANGCTSGHGVCGVSRLSTRSLVATLSFIAAGAASVFVVRHLLGGLS